MAEFVSAGVPDPLSYSFDRKHGQIEVGGPFAGVEFHKSRTLPSRISFYAPVANSIDLSTDYWKRDESRPMAIAVKAGSTKRRWIGRDAWRYTLSPHRVSFFNEDNVCSYQLTYEFCLNEPAMVVTFTVKNLTKTRQRVEVYTHLLLALRTCQTYARIVCVSPEMPVRVLLNGQPVAVQFQNNIDAMITTVFAFDAGSMDDTLTLTW